MSDAGGDKPGGYGLERIARTKRTKKRKIKIVSEILAIIRLGSIGEPATGCALMFGRSSGYVGVLAYRAGDPAQYYRIRLMHAFVFRFASGMTVIYWKR